MKKFFIYVSAVAATIALAASCQKEIDNQTNDPSGETGIKSDKTVVFTATSEKANGKTTIGADGTTVEWASGDVIDILWDGGSTTSSAASAGSTTTFEAEVDPASAYYAVYPASVGSLSADVLSINVPTTQDGTFASSNIAVAKTDAISHNLAFYNATALVKFSVSDPDYTKAVFAGTNGEAVAGEATIDFGDGTSAPTVTAASTAAKSVEVTLSGAGEYYFAVLPGTFSNGFSITLFKNSVAERPKSVQTSRTLGRATILNMGAVDGVASITDYFVKPSGTGSGKSWDKAMGPAQLKALLETSSDSGVSDAKARLLDGVTIHMAAGDYYLAGEAGAKVKVEFNGYPSQVAITFKGGYPAGLTGTSLEGRTEPVGSVAEPSNCTAFTGNGEAGIFLFGNQTNVTFEGITFKNANFTAAGGAVEAAAGNSGNSSLTLSKCRIIDNTNIYTQTGAGVFLSKASANISDCYFGGNKARNGAGLNLNTGEGTVVVENCLFKNNETDNTSGAMQNGSTKIVTVNDCTFEENANGKNRGNQTNIAGLGGAFHESAAGAKTTFNRCLFANNSGWRGGAVSLQAGTLVFNDCQFTSNTATIGSKTNQGDSNETVLGNHGGGAIVLLNANSDCTLNNCSFTTNSAPNGNGGAIAIQNVAANLTINEGCSFTSNTAYNLGGAIFARNGTLNIKGTSASKVTFGGNHTLATGNQHANGGAIWLGDGSTTSIEYATFSNSEAGQEDGETVNYSNGGALCIKAVTKFEADNCDFTACRGRNGGVLNIEAGNSSTVEFTSCSFHDNIGCSGASKDGTGGNFHGAVARFGGSGTTTFSSCSFDKNKAYHGGGAFHINTDNTVICNDCTFTDNDCLGGNNGGTFTMENGTLTINGGSVSGGDAGAGGGMLYLLKGTLNLNNTSVSNCKSSSGQFGGAIYARADAQNSNKQDIGGPCTINSVGTTFSGNKAGEGNNNNDQGGAIRAQGKSGKEVTINLTDCIFTGNSAYRFGLAVSLNQYCYLKANRCVFTGNTGASRGVVSLGSNSLVFLNSCAFNGNSLSDATTWGMAIHGSSAPSAVCMNNCTIYGNNWTHSSPSATQCGLVNGNEPVLLINSTLIESTAFLLRASGSSVHYANNILLNTKTAANIIESSTSTKVSAGHNALSGSTGSDASTDRTNCTLSTFTGGSWSANTASSPYYGVFSWTGGASLATASQSDVTNAIDAFTQAVNAVGVSNAGAAFKTWLNDIGALGIDGRGVARTGAWWPGAYQAN